MTPTKYGNSDWHYDQVMSLFNLGIISWKVLMKYDTF